MINIQREFYYGAVKMFVFLFLFNLFLSFAFASNKTSLETEVTKQIGSKLNVGVNTGYLFDGYDDEFKLEPSMSYQLFPSTVTQVKYMRNFKTDENKLTFKLSLNF